MNIMDELFYGNISGINYKVSDEYKKIYQKETELYDKIKGKLNNEDMELVDNLIKLYSESSAISEKDFYSYGFKTGLLLGIECSKIELE